MSGYFWLDLDSMVYYSVLHDPLVHVVQIRDLATTPCAFGPCTQGAVAVSEVQSFCNIFHPRV